LARKYKRVTQVGTQQRSIPLNNWASDLIQNGAIGKVKVVLAPNFVGLWQINAAVPANSVTGKVPLFVTIGESPAGAVSSNHVSIWVSE